MSGAAAFTTARHAIQRPQRDQPTTAVKRRRRPLHRCRHCRRRDRKRGGHCRLRAIRHDPEYMQEQLVGAGATLAAVAALPVAATTAAATVTRRASCASLRDGVIGGGGGVAVLLRAVVETAVTVE